MVGRSPIREFACDTEASAGQARGHASDSGADRVAQPRGSSRTPTVGAGWETYGGIANKERERDARPVVVRSVLDQRREVATEGLPSLTIIDDCAWKVPGSFRITRRSPLTIGNP